MPRRPEDEINARIFLPEEELDAPGGDEPIDLDAELAAARDAAQATFEDALDALEEGSIELGTLAGLSDLSRDQVRELAAVWRELPAEARATVVQHAYVLGEDDPLLDFSRFFAFALDDESSAVRQVAAHGLAAYDDSALIEPLLRTATTDVSDDVRLAAVEALASFMELVELGTLDAGTGQRLREALLAIARDPGMPATLRAGALESVAVVSGDAIIGETIQRFYDDGDTDLRIGSIRAMGRSVNPRWRPLLEATLRHPEPDQRQEAIGALGAYEDEALVPLLTLIAREDREIMVRLEAIQALGSIGGANAVRDLQTLREYASDDEAAAIDDAIAEAAQRLEADEIDEAPDDIADELRRLGM